MSFVGSCGRGATAGCRLWRPCAGRVAVACRPLAGRLPDRAPAACRSLHRPVAGLVSACCRVRAARVAAVCRSLAGRVPVGVPLVCRLVAGGVSVGCRSVACSLFGGRFRRSIAGVVAPVVSRSFVGRALGVRRSFAGCVLGVCRPFASGLSCDCRLCTGHSPAVSCHAPVVCRPCAGRLLAGCRPCVVSRSFAGRWPAVVPPPVGRRPVDAQPQLCSRWCAAPVVQPLPRCAARVVAAPHRAAAPVCRGLHV